MPFLRPFFRTTLKAITRSLNKMSSPNQYRPASSVPPPVHRGMLELDRSVFKKSLSCLGVKVDALEVGKLAKDSRIRSQILTLPRVKVIESDPNTSNGRLLIMNVSSEDQLNSEVLEALQGHSRGYLPFTVELDYDHWNSSEIFHAILPEDLLDDTPAGFALMGHIAHMNLRDEFLPYKHLIGQVILDKNKNVRTVVNKLDTIDNQFRVFKMEVIAGENNLIAETRESGSKFTFDFSTVYWNSRLGHEHERIVQDYFQPGQVVADVMAGVGPFAVPGAKKGCYVLGNDLNPESVRWMEKNRVDNKVQATLRPSKIDGRAFIQKAPLEAWTNPFPPVAAFESGASQRKKQKEARRLRDEAKARGETIPVEERDDQNQKTQPQLISHYVMNLPDSALEFLDAYAGSFTSLVGLDGFPGQDVIEMPLVHVHCFTREIERENAEVDICKRASGYLGHEITTASDGFHLHFVRRVAPAKDMYCLTFRLPREVAFKST